MKLSKTIEFIFYIYRPLKATLQINENSHFLFLRNTNIHTLFMLIMAIIIITYNKHIVIRNEGFLPVYFINLQIQK